MKSISYNIYPFDPYIPTEETMFKSLELNSTLDDSYHLHKIPFAFLINNFGINYVQNLIYSLDSKQKKILVCQHISVHNLKFDSNTIVCTPHSSVADEFISIPHFPVNIDISKKKEDRKNLFGFIGSVHTHITRKAIVKIFPENCFDSNVYWGLEKKEDKEFCEKYIDNLSNSIFSICPRGTGISSVRLFESIAMGSIPIIIADGYKPPLSDLIDWNKFSIFVPENKVRKIKDILENIDKESISSMQKELNHVYSNFFNEKNFFKSVELKLKKT